jgi:very-short-patch-repair endonuclease
VGVLVSIERARKLRKNSGEPERAMWRLLYTLRQAGHNFRRQVPLGPYYADFACHGLKLVIEIDGDTHGTTSAMTYDAARDQFIRSEGYEVLRFWNNDVMGNPEGVYAVIVAAIDEGPARAGTPTPDPSPQGGGRHGHLALNEDKKRDPQC